MNPVLEFNHLSTDQLLALNEVAKLINRGLSLEKTLDTIVASALKLFNTTYAAMALFEKNGGLAHFVTAGVTDEDPRSFPLDPQLLLPLLAKEPTLFIDNIESQSLNELTQSSPCRVRQLLGQALPVNAKMGGAIFLTDKQHGTFNEIDTQLIKLLSEHATNALYNAQLHDKSQRVAVMEERERFARDLHDSIIQSIYAVGLSLESAKAHIEPANKEAKTQIDTSMTSLAQVINDIRKYIFDLRPQATVYTDLLLRLEGLIQELKFNIRLPIIPEIDPQVDQLLNERQASHVFHICHEALSNAARHAKANKIWLTLILSEPDTVELVVKDDGIGFEKPETINYGHRGLGNIRSRVAQLNGDLTIDSQPGHGTEMRLFFKL